ncbi:MAG: methyltransferase domain-containing protein [Planctomycetes bacterium]|nr:methyltransferase domain-containing protein [Planctomycetota bacterium]
MRCDDLRCPRCGAELAFEGDALACGGCGARHPLIDGVADLRGDRERPREPSPAAAAPLDDALARLGRGEPFKAALERLLLDLDDAAAERLMLLLREGRGAWHPLARARGGSVLLLANALSGAAVPLAAAGFDVTVVDPCVARARFGEHRNRALGRGTRTLVAGDVARLPFADASFDLVVQENGVPGAANEFAHSLDECRRVARGEVVLIADNRLGYKRSAGRRGAFHVPSPAVWLRDVLAPRRGERTLGGYRALLARDGFARPRAFALYPHSREFAHVVALDDEWPKLSIGPKERRNRLKIVADRAGLFPLFTPSYALFASRAERERPRVERVLDELAQRVGEPRPRVEQWIATRGNTIVWLCATSDDVNAPSGRWCVHVPLSPQQREQVERHHATLAEFATRFPSVPVPEPLFVGEIDGLFLACERRLGGLTAPQLTGDHGAAARMFAETATHLARLVVAPATPLDRAGFDEVIGAKCELVARFAAVESTRRAIDALRGELERELVGVPLPRVRYHADLRSKHVQVDEHGGVVGFLDWGSSEPSGLPYFDLLHLITHERKQEAGLTAAAAWRIVLGGDGLRVHERTALANYAGALGLDRRITAGITRLYPILVGAMAEQNWDYSRPRWVHRQFGI